MKYNTSSLNKLNTQHILVKPVKKKHLKPNHNKNYKNYIIKHSPKLFIFRQNFHKTRSMS